MLMHQGIGLGAFNALSRRGATHALYECCASLTWAQEVAAGRPYASYPDLFARADAALFSARDAEIAEALDCHPVVGRRRGSTASRLEQCSLWDEDEALTTAITAAVAAYEERFGHRYLWCPQGRGLRDLLTDLRHRLAHDPEAERKVCTEELAKITRTRLERMLGPEDGFPLY